MEPRVNPDDFGIAVIIPTYNSTSHLEETVNRVLSEGVNEVVEIIVIDDASTDTTAEILRECTSNEKVRGYILSENVGQAEAVRVGIQLANCRYVLSMDDDLQYAPSEIRKLIEVAKKSEGFQIVFGVPRKRSRSDLYVAVVKIVYRIINCFIPWLGSERSVTSFFLMDRFSLKQSFHPLFPWEWNSNKVFFTTVEHFPSIRNKTSYSILKLLRQFAPLILFLSTRLIVFLGFPLVLVLLVHSFRSAAFAIVVLLVFYLLSHWGLMSLKKSQAERLIKEEMS